MDTKIRSVGLAGGLALAALLAGTPAAPAADRVAAMVLDVAGTTVPPIEAYSELADRTTVTLQPGTHLTFIHYGSCKQVTVTGGKLYVDRTRFSLAGGKVDNEERTNCPGEQKLAADATGGNATGAAAIVMRNLPPTPSMSGHPVIVLAGAHAGDITKATLFQGSKALGPMSAVGRRVFWPTDRPALVPGEDYRAHLTTADGHKAVEFKFAVAAPEAAGKAPVILRLD